jgi:DNA-binding MarR family transcriptional regulator
MKDADDAQTERLTRRRKREDTNVFGRLSAASAASRTEAQKTLKAAGDLSVVEWRILWDLYEAGPLTVRDMALIQRADHSLISRALPGLTRRGRIVVSRDGQDKRQTMVALTDAGRAAYEQSAPVMKARRDRLRAAFSPQDLMHFIRLIDTFEAYLGQEAERSKPQKDDQT